MAPRHRSYVVEVSDGKQAISSRPMSYHEARALARSYARNGRRARLVDATGDQSPDIIAPAALDSGPLFGGRDDVS